MLKKCASVISTVLIISGIIGVIGVAGGVDCETLTLTEGIKQIAVFSLIICAGWIFDRIKEEC